MRPTVYLFDIDGTLLDGGGSGRRAMEGAFAEVTGDRTALAGIRFAGMTDPAIVRAGLRVAGRDPGQDAAVIPAVIERYLARLPDEIAATHEFRLLGGVIECLDALAAMTDVAIGLGTGNVERGARLKLGVLGVADAFGFGGFACDHEDRAALVGVGAQRGWTRLRRAATAVRTIVIGDTPKDVAAAKANGLECLAVATGQFGVDELRACGADRVVADLGEPQALAYLRG